MLRNVILFFAILIGSFVWIHRAMENGDFLRYLDAHPHPEWTPRVLYYTGQGQYLFQDLAEAATYFYRIPTKFPQSKEADDAQFYYVQVQDDMRALDRDELILAYQEYVEKFPNGEHVGTANERISSFKTGAR